jgi:hypothetical protein
MKIISPKVHAILDYAVVLLLFCAPFVFNFGTAITIFTLALAFIHLFMTLITDFPGGLIALLGLRVHGLVELAVSVLLMIFALVADLEQAIESYFYIAFSATVFITWLFTDYNRKT